MVCQRSQAYRYSVGHFIRNSLLGGKQTEAGTRPEQKARAWHTAMSRCGLPFTLSGAELQSAVGQPLPGVTHTRGLFCGRSLCPCRDGPCDPGSSEPVSA